MFRAHHQDEVIEEIADLYEVIDAFLMVYGIKKEDVRKVQRQKFLKKGGFSKRAFVGYVDVVPGSKEHAYYKDKTEVCPEINP